MSNSFRKMLRRSVAYALYYSGVLWLLAAIKLRNRAVVLMYHRVVPAGADTFSEEAIVVRPETFARQMAFLKRYMHPLSTDELAELMRQKRPLPSMSCVVTFDDGWIDNFEHALPILREQRMPATIYVATDFIGSDDCFWQERVTRRMVQALQSEATRPLVERETQPGLAQLPPLSQRRAVRAAVTRIKKWPAEQLQAFERTLTQALEQAGLADRSTGYDRFMSWAQVAGLPRDSRVLVGSHGCSHRPLDSIPPQDSQRELRSARERIASAGAGPADSVAYPNGDFDSHVLSSARAAGYRTGFTTEKGTVSAEDDPLRLRRINIHQAATDTLPEFLCAMLLVFHRLRRTSPGHAHPRH